MKRSWRKIPRFEENLFLWRTLRESLNIWVVDRSDSAQRGSRALSVRDVVVAVAEDVLP